MKFLNTNSLRLDVLKQSLAFFAVILLALSSYPVFGQTSNTITATTDKASYSDGDKITISGSVGQLINIPISIVIRDPNQQVVMIGQTSPGADNSYSTQVTSGGSLWTTPGTYEITVTYGSKDTTAKTTFTFTGLKNYPIEIQGTAYNATYKITNGKITSITPDTNTKSLTISIQSLGNGSLQIILPRNVIDAKQGQQDSQFSLQEDGTQVTPQETKTDISRTLTIPFQSNTKEITITGTQIIPEFGPLSFIVLTSSMIILFMYLRLYQLKRSL